MVLHLQEYKRSNMQVLRQLRSSQHLQEAIIQRITAFFYMISFFVSKTLLIAWIFSTDSISFTASILTFLLAL